LWLTASIRTAINLLSCIQFHLSFVKVNAPHLFSDGFTKLWACSALHLRSLLPLPNVEKDRDYWSWLRQFFRIENLIHTVFVLNGRSFPEPFFSLFVVTFPSSLGVCYFLRELFGFLAIKCPA
jgi:hypothetical protein